MQLRTRTQRQSVTRMGRESGAERGQRKGQTQRDPQPGGLGNSEGSLCQGQPRGRWSLGMWDRTQVGVLGDVLEQSAPP